MHTMYTMHTIRTIHTIHTIRTIHTIHTIRTIRTMYTMYYAYYVYYVLCIAVFLLIYTTLHRMIFFQYVFEKMSYVLRVENPGPSEMPYFRRVIKKVQKI